MFLSTREYLLISTHKWLWPETNGFEIYNKIPWTLERSWLIFNPIRFGPRFSDHVVYYTKFRIDL